MGVRPLLASVHLAEKLRFIRKALGRHEGAHISQEQLIIRLARYDERIKDVIGKSNISGYERGHNVPPPPVLLAYARLAGVCMEVLVDDSLELPDRLPVQPGHKAHP